MTTKTLRALAKDYAEGILDKDNYRKARDAYFKAVLAGNIRVKPIDYRPPVDIQDLDATQEKTAIRPQKPKADSPVIEPADNNRENSSRTQHTQQAIRTPASPYLLVSAVILIIAAVGVSFALLRTSGETLSPTVVTRQPVDTEITQTAPEPVMSQPASPAEILIENFLEENNWSDDNLQQFRDDWQALSAAEQEQGLSSPMRAQLVNAIHQKLVEERALLGLGDTENVVARQHKLVNFATELNINDPRLKVEGEAVNQSLIQTESEENTVNTTE